MLAQRVGDQGPTVLPRRARNRKHSVAPPNSDAWYVSVVDQSVALVQRNRLSLSPVDHFVWYCTWAPRTLVVAVTVTARCGSGAGTPGTRWMYLRARNRGPTSSDVMVGAGVRVVDDDEEPEAPAGERPPMTSTATMVVARVSRCAAVRSMTRT